MPHLTIEKIIARPVLAPLTRPIKTAVGSIEQSPLVLLDVTTKEGVVGRSYLFAYTPIVLESLCKLVNSIGETLIGKHADPIARYKDLERTFQLLGRQGLVAMAIAGFDMAFWDANGKAVNCSVAQLLGANHDPIQCYDSHGMFVKERDLDLIDSSLEAGFKALKFKLGGGTLKQDIEAVGILSDAVGEEVELMVDYNQSLSSAEAVRRIRSLEDKHNLTWVEEPISAEDYAGYKRIKENVNTALQMGENWWLPEDAVRAIDAQITDHVMLDIMKIGGITGWLQSAPVASAASLPISSHIFIEASAHVMAATPGRYLLEYLDVAGSVLKDPYEIENGILKPKGPGLGIEWDEKVVQKLTA